VHNEWRGTFDEFEEAVEFGELDLFLRIESGGADSAVPVVTPTPQASSSQSITPADTNGSSTKLEAVEKPLPRATSHSVKLLDRLAQPRAPSMNSLAPALPHAPSGSGFRKEHDAESFLSSLGISDLNLTEEELNEILEEGKDDKAGASIPASSSGERGNGKYPSDLGISSSKPAVARTYTPSAEAGIKPLRLARMGDSSQKASSSASPLRTTPSARFNASHLSSKALAAEAQASISSRAISSVKIREAVSKGDKLEDAFRSTRDASRADEKENVVGREDLDDLMASLGLSDVKMSEEEAEAFLMDGTIPTGLDMHGDRLGRAGGAAEKARSQAAARDVAKKAKEKGYGSENSRPASVASSSGLTDPPEEHNVEEERKVAKESDVPTEEKVGEVLIPEEVDKVDEEAVGAEESKELEAKSGAVDSEVAAESPSEAKDDEEGNHAKEVIEDKGDEASIAEAEPTSDLKCEEEEDSIKPTADTNAQVDTQALNSSEDTPMQRKIDLPVVSSDSDTTKGKTSTSSVATLLEVQVHAPSEDIDTAPEDGEGVSNEDRPADENRERSLDAESVETNAVDAKNDANESKEASSGLDEDGVKEPSEAEASSPTQHSSKEKEEAPIVPKLPEEVPEVQPAVSEESPPTTEKALLPELPFSPARGQANLSASKSLSPPLSPNPALASSSKPKSPSTEKATLSPNLIQTSPSTSRRQNSNDSLSPSRRAMDLPRSMSSDSSISEDLMPPSNSPHQSSPSNIEGSRSPKSPMSMKSPKSATKKFFGIGRRRRKSGEQESDEEEDVQTSSVNVPSPITNNRSQKTLSMILREADEALNGASDDEDGYDDDEGAFSHDFDAEGGADDGIEVETAR
jgi:hypothetical protein